MDIDIDIPKIDLPTDWIIGTDISKELLSLYKNFPCRLKVKMFVFCKGGEVEASINLSRITVKENDFVTILPGNILQIHNVEGDLKIYFMGFSSRFIESLPPNKNLMEIFYAIKESPVISIRPKGAELLEEYYKLLINVYGFCGDNINHNLLLHLYQGAILGVCLMYRDKANLKVPTSKGELLHREFRRLVMKNYNQERNVAWYANQLGISQAYLCTTIKSITGKTCLDIISSMVIMDAKSQLKSTDLPVNLIASSLGFNNMSFFGKYFKRYVGVGPMEYRNKG